MSNEFLDAVEAMYQEAAKAAGAEVRQCRPIHDGTGKKPFREGLQGTLVLENRRAR